MPIRFRPFSRFEGGGAPRDWREYQRRLQRDTLKHKSRRRWIGPALVAAGILIAVYLSMGPGAKDPKDATASIPPEGSTPPLTLDKTKIRTLIPEGDLLNRTSSRFVVSGSDHPLTVETTLDTSLQQSLIDGLDTANARFIGIVAIAPPSGQVLAMARYDRDDPTVNPCLDSRFPAASVFKIITAAAAIEQCDLNGDSPMTFNGNQYTLYRSQLKDKVTRHTNRIRFQDAFAKSVNPVFGKLGALKLGKDNLTNYAVAFGFNRPIDFEAAISPSTFTVSDDPYQLAEVASGFNRETTLSHLHGALIAAAVANDGRIYEPTVVERILDANGKEIYHSTASLLAQPMAPQTAAQIAAMMEASVRIGTCHKPFRDQDRHPVLSRLVIGGKSGSIDNQDHTARIDWFVGFASERDGNQAIAVSAVVAHEKYIGKRAGEYARRLITDYFGGIFAARHSASNDG